MSRSRRLLLVALASGGLLLWGLESAAPVGTHLTRLAQLGGLSCAVGALLGLAAHQTRRVVTLLLAGSSLVVLLSPRRDVDEARVREHTVLEARALLETPYVWGGENGAGIDCSGLVRTAFRRALVQEAMRGLNPALLREALELWYFDASALALKDGYREFARQLGSAPAGVNGVPAGALRPGDFMVTANGLHTMLFVGEGAWIEADPRAGRVILERTPTTNPWFLEPAVLLRWAVLATAP